MVQSMTNVAHNVTAPPVAPYRFGLFSVAAEAPPDDGHAFGVGLYTWESDWCGEAVAVTHSPCVQDNPEAIAVDSTLCNLSQFQPFWVYAYSQGGAGAFMSDELSAQARDRIANGAQYAVEAQLWTQMDTAITQVAVTGGPQGLGYIEQLLAQNYKGLGVIHMGRYAATILGQQGLLMADGPVLRTKLGTPVVAGAGYQQVGGALPATYDVFGTGPVVVVGGATTIIPAVIDTAINNVHALAFKPYVAGWDCTAVGVTIT
jgi:hypothetical protein